jgi:putative FmdB family regulatory protein
VPIYEWACPKCARVDETLTVNITEKPETPMCCNQDMERIISKTSFTFRTAGGNNLHFSGAAGPYTRNARKQATIGEGHGLGGHRGRHRPTSTEKLKP